jgi:AraC-like DNA-binding protein
MTHRDNSDHLRRAATARHEATLDRARHAIAELDRTGHPVTIAAVARAAHVSRSWLYKQPELRDTINRLHTATTGATSSASPVAQRATPDSIRQRLDATRQEIRRLRAENAALRDQLARTLGQQRANRKRPVDDMSTTRTT